MKMRLSRVILGGLVPWAAFFASLAIAAPAVAEEFPADSPIAAALEKAEKGVAAIVAAPAGERNFESTLGALDAVLTHLETDTGMTLFMQHVSTDGEERKRSQLAEEHYSNWLVGLFKREDLYKAVKAFADTNPKLEGEQKRLLEHTLRDFRRDGMALPPEKRAELKALQVEINKLGLEFEQNIREDDPRVPLTRDELKGMSEDFLATLPQTSGLYIVGMDYPTFYPLQDLCESEMGRKKMWIIYKRRGGVKNVELLEKILALRAKAATLLGYPNAADYEMEPRMAKTAKQVKEFYAKLQPVVKKKAEQDFAEFLTAKRQQTGDPNAKLYPWDAAFCKHDLMKSRYAVDSEKVREYFPMERVVEGLFNVTQSLYGIEYRDVTARAGTKDRPIWFPEVRLYEVWDKKANAALGEFYLDLYPRPNKYKHAAQWGLVSRRVWPDGTVQKPLAALVCNFTKPTADKPSLLTHSEVETFFHEFGHCLHTILTETHYGRFAGSNVSRDFVEAPSQMFENWVWDADVLKTFARHYKTGEPFPDELLRGMIAARNLGSGLDAERQFFYGITDLEYHLAPDGKVDTRAVAERTFGECEHYEPVAETWYQASFGHFIGYQAGYYGYQWARVYAQDMMARFREKGMLNPEAGLYYRKKILARGGSLDELELVRDYLGREPKMDAYLEFLGLSGNK